MFLTPNLSTWLGPATTRRGPTVIHGETAMDPVRNTDWFSRICDTLVRVSSSVMWIASASSLKSDCRLRSPAMKRASNCTVTPVSAAALNAMSRVVYTSAAFESSFAK